MALLAIETSGDLCSVALGIENAVLERRITEPRGHNRLLLPAIDELLAESGYSLGRLDALVVGVGPGSFTGLRIGIGVAQGLAFGADLGVIPVSSLAALAQAGVRTGVVAEAGLALPALDARMGQMYWGLYRRRGALVDALGEDRLDSPAAMAAAAGALLDKQVPTGLGGGWKAVSPDLPVRPVKPEVTALALDVLRLAEPLWTAGALVSPEQLEPRYLRGSDHWRRQEDGKGGRT
jgi:tRNA threonylcarbamoyladenosine biosynthesis protein TsaB